MHISNFSNFKEIFLRKIDILHACLVLLVKTTIKSLLDEHEMYTKLASLLKAKQAILLSMLSKFQRKISSGMKIF